MNPTTTQPTTQPGGQHRAPYGPFNSVSPPSRLSTAAKAALIDSLCALLNERQPQTRGELQQIVRASEVDINVALDQAQTEARIQRRIIAGRIVYALADWEQPKPGMQKRVAAPPEAPGAAQIETPVSAGRSEEAEPEQVVPPAPRAAEPPSPLPSPVSGPFPSPPPTGQQTVLAALRQIGAPASVSDLRLHCGLDVTTIKGVVKALRVKGLAACNGKAGAARWTLTEAGQAAALLCPTAAAPEPAAEPPRVEAAPAAVPEPQPVDTLLAWHAERAEQEAEARQQAAAAEPTPLIPPGFVLHEAMSNSGSHPSPQVESDSVALVIGEARYALWSDGRLEIESDADSVLLSANATRALFTYLDGVCAIELPQ